MGEIKKDVYSINVSINFLNDIRVRKLIGKYGAEVVSVLIYVLTHYNPEYQALL